MQESNPLTEVCRLDFDKRTKELQNLNCMEVVEIIKKAICDHQKLMVEFMIKTSISSNQIKKTKAILKLEEYMVNLFVSFRETLENSCIICMNYLNTYFELDGRHTPRFILKGLRQTDKHVIDSYRGTSDPLPDSYSFNSIENTAFDIVNHEKDAYCSNNIPLDAKSNIKSRQYINKRLIKDRVENYKNYELTEVDRQAKYLSHDEYAHTARDEKWEQCWVGYNDKILSYRSYYKSTLVVPVVLSHIDLFTKKALMIDGEYNSAIFGYLCFDDVCAEYFVLPRDKHVGYIFSDILSLYNVAMKYFEHSLLKEEIAKLNSKRPDWKKKIGQKLGRIDR